MTEESSVTLDEFISDSTSLIAQNLAGAGAENQCTYEKGYLKRQNVYTCKTCSDKYSKLAALCFHCSAICHKDHELVDTGPKRSFRCDCGNNILKNICVLNSGKEPYNDKNVYNHNFKDQFCTCNCSETSPDCDEDIIQCRICEDWFHLTHIGGDKDSDNLSGDLFCPMCVNKYPELTVLTHSDEKKNHICFKDYNSIEDIPIKPYFTSPDYIEDLNSCQPCQNWLKENKLEFLFDKEDTHEFYELMGEKVVNSCVDNDINEFIDKMPHENKLNFITGLNTFRESFVNMIKKIDGKDEKLVTKEDMEAMLEEWSESRRKIPRL